MARPTPSVSLAENQIATLKAIMENNPEGSSPFKRAGVLLGCAEGKRGTELAKQYHVTTNMVTDWRRKFEKGGVEGLMSDAPRPGKSVKDGVPIIDLVKKALAETPPDADSWTSLALAKHLEISHRSVRKALEKLGIKLAGTTEAAQAVLPDLTDKKVCIVGLFISVTVQILALVISSAADTPFFQEKKRITVNDGSTQSQKQLKPSSFELDLACALDSLSDLAPRDGVDRTNREAADFVRNLENCLKHTGHQLYLVLNAPKPSSIVTDKSLIGMQLSSTEEFKTTASRWFQAIDCGSKITTLLSENTNSLLDHAPRQSKPFSWQVTPVGYQPQSSLHTLPAGHNKLKFNIEYTDAGGSTIICSKELLNAIPNSRDFAQSKTIDEYLRRVGELEQAIVKGTQEVDKEFMTQALGVGSTQANLETLKKN